MPEIPQPGQHPSAEPAKNDPQQAPGAVSKDSPKGNGGVSVKKPPRWKTPSPLGLSAARETMSGSAAPLLAAISIVLVGVVAQVPESFRWPAWSIFLLVLATALLVACVQFGFVARAYLYSPKDLDDWRPPADEEEWMEECMRTRQVANFGHWERWSLCSSVAYNLGVASLAAAVGVTVAPPLFYSHQAVVPDDDVRLRCIAMVIAFMAGLIEFIWALYSGYRSYKSGSDLRDR